MAREIKQWITINGVHVPIFEGQSKDEAVKNYIDKKSEGESKSSKKKAEVSSKIDKDEKTKQEQIAKSESWRKEINSNKSELYYDKLTGLKKDLFASDKQKDIDDVKDKIYAARKELDKDKSLDDRTRNHIESQLRDLYDKADKKWDEAAKKADEDSVKAAKDAYNNELLRVSRELKSGKEITTRDKYVANAYEKGENKDRYEVKANKDGTYSIKDLSKLDNNKSVTYYKNMVIDAMNMGRTASAIEDFGKKYGLKFNEADRIMRMIRMGQDWKSELNNLKKEKK
jgi:hypothetical protein